MNRFVIRRGKTGFQFDLLAPNGQVLATSEVYLAEAGCRRGMASVCRNAPGAPVEDCTAEGPPVKNPKFQLYADRNGRYRFRLLARNGEIIAASKGYSTKAACLRGLASLRRQAASAEYLDITKEENDHA